MKKKVLYEKIIKAMKITIAQMFIAICCISIGYTHPVDAQSELKQKIYLQVQDESLSKVLKQIEKQAEIRFVFSSKLIQSNQKVNATFAGDPLSTVLDNLLQPRQLEYKVVDKVIILRKIEDSKAFIMLPLLPNQLDKIEVVLAFVVTGTITDDKNEPLIGASVVLKGTSKGTVTDINGNFRLELTDEEKTGTLVISFVGYDKQEIAIANQKIINVHLTSAKALDEVVVVGYGTQKKRDVTGNIARIAGSAIQDAPVQSFDQALSGRAAGVNVTVPNGLLGNPPVIRVRGINSISLSSFPLIVIDGIPAWSGDVGGFAHNNALADINPSDIESFEILKDAAASAIYGSRAAAGVVLITTKKGKLGKAKVVFENWVGSSQVMNQMEMLNAEEYTLIKNEALANAGTPANETSRGFYTMKGPDGKLVDTRWSDYAYRKGYSQNYNLNISGANESTQYFFSVGYTNQQGIFYTNDFNRKTGRFTLDHKVNSRITVGGSFNYSNSFNQGLISGTPTEDRPEAVFAASGATRLAMILPPNVGVYKNDGTWNYNGLLGMGQGNNLTPLTFLPNFRMALELNSQTSQTDRIMSNIYIAIKLLKGMEFKTVYGIDNLLVENKEYRNPYNGEGSRFSGAASNIMGRYQRYNLQNLLSYNITLKDKHSLGFLVGVEQQKSTRSVWGADRRIVADSLYTTYQGAYSTIFPFGNKIGINFLQSYFGRVNYDFKKKYYLSINARRDGYSAFAPGKKFGNFAGASMGWMLSQEDFFIHSSIAKTLNSLQLRASYGKVGNNLGIGDFAFNNLYTSGLNGINNTLFFSQAGNQSLTWETSKKLDIGFSYGLFDNRITGEVAYYKNTIDGLILDDPQSPSAGIPGNSILNNVGSMWNKGWEFTVNAVVVRKKGFTWKTSINFTTQQNRITALAAGNADILLTTSTLAPLSIVRVGESLGSFYAIKSGAINPDNGRRIFYYRDGTAVQYDASASSSALRWTYLDGKAAPRSPNQNNDGIVIGPALPKFFGGFDNNFIYKEFDLNVLLFFSGGNYMFNGTKATVHTPTTANSTKDVLTRWQKPGDITNVPRQVFGDIISNGSRDFVISEDVEKADFVKIRNIALGYTLLSSLSEKAGLSKVRFYVAVQNAFVFTKYTGFDPEISTNKNSTGTPSVDFHSPPMARSFSFGVNISF